MSPDKIVSHIDNKILIFLEENHLPQSIYLLDNLIEKFMSKDSFIDYEEDYLVKNWVNIPFKTRYTTYFVLACLNRRVKIKWIIDNKYNKLTDLNDKTKYKLFLFKEKISNSFTTI